MTKVLSKFKEIIGLSEEEDFEDYEENEVVEEEYEQEELEPVIQKQKGNKVVNIHSSATAKVMITKPQDYENARDISEALKNRKIVLVNASALETKIAQRLVDFISGACYVLNAELQEIEHRVYLLTPSNVEVTNELKNELSSKALFSWNK